MAKKTIDLDTPFRKNERVITTRDVLGIGAHTPGKVQLQNGLGEWKRYWVHFEGHGQVGQISHDDLVRPLMLDEWDKREEQRADAAANAAANAAAAEAATAAADEGGGGSGIASQIPAALLERSKAAKARLLG